MIERKYNSIISCFNSQNFPHAVSLVGNADEYADAAKFLSACLMCGNSAEKPCMKCSNCAKVLAGGHPDITITDNSDGKLSVETVRNIRADAYVLPGEANCRVFVFLAADKLSVICQNALLKILEEPPKNVYFLLCCENPYMLLQTVRSRLTEINIENIRKQGEITNIAADTVDLALSFCREVAAMNEISIMENAVKIDTLASGQAEKMFTLMKNIAAFACVYGITNDCPPDYAGAAKQMHEKLENTELIALAGLFEKLAKRSALHANSSALAGALCAEIAEILQN